MKLLNIIVLLLCINIVGYAKDEITLTPEEAKLLGLVPDSSLPSQFYHPKKTNQKNQVTTKRKKQRKVYYDKEKNQYIYPEQQISPNVYGFTPEKRQRMGLNNQNNQKKQDQTEQFVGIPKLPYKTPAEAKYIKGLLTKNNIVYGITLNNILYKLGIPQGGTTEEYSPNGKKVVWAYYSDILHFIEPKTGRWKWIEIDFMFDYYTSEMIYLKYYTYWEEK